MPTALAKRQAEQPATASTTTLPKPSSSSSNTLSSTDPILQTLAETVPPHFQQAQHSLANHRKNIVSLHRIHLSASKVTEKSTKGTRLVGEKAFNEIFFQCLDRVLPVKKGVANADRISKFVAGYAAYAQEQFRLLSRSNAPSKKQAGQDEEDEEEEEDTPATRFVSLLLKHLLKGFSSKNKNVRFRCCGSVALLINGLESLDEGLFQSLKTFLLARAKDKESAVRVQAIIALAKLQASEDEDAEKDEDGDEDDVEKVLINTLRFDPSAEVRRAALFNLTPTRSTLPFIVERLRDVDPINRRCVYLGSLTLLLQSSAKLAPTAGSSKFGLDRLTTEEVVRIGLGEREASVKRAARKLVGTWIDSVGGDLIAFLNQFDMTQSSNAEAALQSIFESKPQIISQLRFDQDTFWMSLTPETTFLARVFIDHCKAKGDDVRLEECLPLVTALAFKIQKEYQDLISKLESEEDDDTAAKANGAFILSQLLGIAMSADYGDEIGRRKMFGLVREMISNPLLPEDLIPSCLDVLLKLSNGQRDFMRMIVEIVQELEGGDGDVSSEKQSTVGDFDEEDEDRLEARAAEKALEPKPEPTPMEAALESRRLTIVRAMLERVIGALQENSAFHGLIPQLIAPAVRSKDARIREQGLTCLGLCCLLDKKLALDTFPLFLDQVQRGKEEIKLRSIQCVFDLLIVHGLNYLCSRNPSGEEVAVKQITNYLLSMLEDDDARVQCSASEGMAKLMLIGMVQDDEALKSLVLVYMSPETCENQELRQCLSYFLPVYCCSSVANQRRLQRVFVPILQVLTEVYQEMEEDQEMVTPHQVGMQLVEWTDPAKLVLPEGRQPDTAIQVDVAVDLIQAMFKIDDRDERKVMCQLLSKLYLPDDLEEWKVKQLMFLGRRLKELNPFEDAVTRNSFERWENMIVKTYPDSLPSKDRREEAGEVLKRPEFEGMVSFFESLGFPISEDGETLPPSAGSKKKNVKSSRPSRSSGSKARASKSRRKEESESESEEEGQDQEEEVEEEEEEEEDSFEI
ncbi:ARM repeat-containing protein [Violaceomyces palustris]|uniref:ARM repeat-containing protein n=1 Tax=Violaceomyces palustris TaxID=1673888 RepID=A0ACD0P4T9_9BASI|nr:ARM repeat-containing protein [Violaceomyces palustris]